MVGVGGELPLSKHDGRQHPDHPDRAPPGQFTATAASARTSHPHAAAPDRRPPACSAPAIPSSRPRTHHRVCENVPARACACCVARRRHGCVLVLCRVGADLSSPPSNPPARLDRPPAALPPSTTTTLATTERLWLRPARRRHAPAAGRLWPAPCLWRLHKRPQRPARSADGTDGLQRRPAVPGPERMFLPTIEPALE